MKSLVSVIIPTFKGATKLSRAIDSVIDQTYKPIEIIVVDDNEPLSSARKDTERVLSKYENFNIKYIRHTKNRNGSAARNTGILNSKGEYLSFLDDDDFYFPERVEKSVKILQNNCSCDAVYCGVVLTNRSEISGVIFAEKELTQKDLLLNEMALGTGSNIFIKRKVIDTLKGFDEKFRRHQDLEFMLRLLDKFRVTNIDEIMIVKGTNGTNNIPKYKEYKMAKDMFFEKFKKQINFLEEQDQRRFYNYHYSKLFISAIQSTDKSNIKEEIRNVKNYRQLSIKERLLKFMLTIRFYNSMPYKVLKKIYHFLKPSKIKVNEFIISTKKQELINKFF